MNSTDGSGALIKIFKRQSFNKIFDNIRFYICVLLFENNNNITVSVMECYRMRRARHRVTNFSFSNSFFFWANKSDNKTEINRMEFPLCFSIKLAATRPFSTYKIVVFVVMRLHLYRFSSLFLFFFFFFFRCRKPAARHSVFHRNKNHTNRYIK